MRTEHHPQTATRAPTTGTGRRAIVWAAVAVLLGATACRGDDAAPPPRAPDVAAPPIAAAADVAPPRAEVGAGDPERVIRIPAGACDLDTRPDLRARLRASAFGYFRYTNIPFAQAVCARFAADIEHMPTVNLHGDAHLGNYAVTENGRGMTDFDDSSAGPAVLDLVRFGVSIALACRERRWSDEVGPLIDVFLDAYRAALVDPDAPRPAPAWAQRVRAGFTSDRRAFLAEVDGLMHPIPPAVHGVFEAGYARYRAVMEREHPELPRSFFAVKRAGKTQLGVGSATSVKFLVRAEGPTASPDDDVVLEVKEVRDISAIACVQARAGGGAFRILVGHARLADVPHRFVAQVPRGPDDPPGTPSFWVHEWYDSYAEIDVSKEPRDPAELREIVYDVGCQLGRGHPAQIAAPFDAELREAQLASLDRQRVAIRAAIDALTRATLRGWERFREVEAPCGP